MQNKFVGSQTTEAITEVPKTVENKLDRLLSDREGAQTLGCGRSTFWRWVSDGILPKPLKIGGMSRWKRSDLEAVIAKAEANREAA